MNSENEFPPQPTPNSFGSQSTMTGEQMEQGGVDAANEEKEQCAAYLVGVPKPKPHPASDYETTPAEIKKAWEEYKADKPQLAENHW
ncbi:unnamed protein product [Cutaneotrichosporon oleaginosum]